MTVNAIWLDGWLVHEIKQTPDGTVVEASYLPQPDCCPKCGVIDRLYRHGSKVVPYRDTPAFGAKMLIRAKVDRFRCRDCGGTSERHHVTPIHELGRMPRPYEAKSICPSCHRRFHIERALSA